MERAEKHEALMLQSSLTDEDQQVNITEEQSCRSGCDGRGVEGPIDL